MRPRNGKPMEIPLLLPELIRIKYALRLYSLLAGSPPADLSQDLLYQAIDYQIRAQSAVDTGEFLDFGEAQLLGVELEGLYRDAVARLAASRTPVSGDPEPKKMPRQCPLPGLK